MNGLTRRYQNTSRFQIDKTLALALGGVLLGVFVLSIFKLPQKFTYFLIAGPIILLIAILSGRFKRFFQGVLIFIIPLNYSTHFFRRPYKFGTTTGLDLSPLDIVLFVLYAVWIYELIFKKDARVNFFPKITIPIFCFIGVSALSMIKAPDPYLALYATVRAVKGGLLFLYIANHFQSKKDLSFILILLLIGLFIQSMIAFSQRWLGISLGLEFFGEYREQSVLTLTHDYYLTVARVGGTIGHPNNLAKYVELLVPIAMVMLFTDIRAKYKLASGLIFVCGFIVLLLTLSRGGWVCFAGSVLLVLFFIFKARLISLRTLVGVAVAGILFASVFLAFSGMIQSRLFGDDYGAAQSRIPLNRIAYSAIRTNPLLGVGNQNLWSVLYLHNPNLETTKSEQMVHNAYLLRAAETGILGLLTFLWLLAAIIWQGIANLRTRDIFLACFNIGCIAGLAAFFAHWLVAFGYLGDWPIVWIMMGMIAASTVLCRSRRTQYENETATG
jgi:O-antigen ligase